MKYNYQYTPNKFFTIIFFLLCFSNANAAVYKWTDENGNVIYGDKPVSKEADEIIIKKAPTPDQNVQDRMDEQNRLLDIIQQERKEKLTSKKEERKKKKEQKEVCAAAEQDLQKNKDASVLYTETDDPNNPKIWTAKERWEEMKKFEKFMKENC